MAEPLCDNHTQTADWIRALAREYYGSAEMFFRIEEQIQSALREIGQSKGEQD